MLYPGNKSRKAVALTGKSSDPGRKECGRRCGRRAEFSVTREPFLHTKGQGPAEENMV